MFVIVIYVTVLCCRSNKPVQPKVPSKPKPNAIQVNPRQVMEFCFCTLMNEENHPIVFLCHFQKDLLHEYHWWVFYSRPVDAYESNG